MIRTFDVIAGVPVASVAHLDGVGALARKREVEARLASIRVDPRADLSEREALKAENLALDARLRDLREEAKAVNVRRNFAGIGSPLHEAIVERLPAADVAELEAAALRKLADRERRSAERRAAKAIPRGPNGGRRPGAGRPRGSGEGRTLAIQTRVTPEEHEAIGAAADDEGVSIAVRARRCDERSTKRYSGK